MGKVLLFGFLGLLGVTALIVDASVTGSGGQVQLGSKHIAMQPASNWQSVFTEHGIESVDGVLVLFDVAKQTLRSSNLQRANSGYVPASTFNIANGLIALELGVVKDVDLPLPWEPNQSFTGAFKSSQVPVFEHIASNIDKQRMANMLAYIDYGNQSISGGFPRFWLAGDLRISAIEQIQFLHRLHSNTLPLSLHSQALIKQLMQTDSSESYALYAAAGYGGDTLKGVGWWIGWVEQNNNTVFFALNIDMASMQQASLGQAIVKAVLLQEQLIQV
ncbi:penicillin-binding transpeptidase domain-containing protein [Shewanella youngdeokensis]|uniref:Penicillin-binding transpeptidase domain-containing protein n=1 Tax=Shewanella youngdeokensis TaxID=2999068 RepID=A0ABZ0JZ83_9GAMM|nr:penicillin-binding transpeptidase domain-containing protein [Shewanella sp. DAU334]